MDKVLDYSTLAAIGLGVYTISMLVIGAWSSKQIKSAEDYIVAGRRLRFPLLFGTILATWICGGVFMGGMGESYQYGFQGALMDPFGPGLWLIIAPVFFVILMRRGRFMTITDMIATRFSDHAGLICSIGVVISEILWVSATTTAFGSIISTFFGWPLWIGIVFGGIVLIVYTWQGGMWAVTVTDFPQMILLAIGMVVMLVTVIGKVGGWSVFVANAAARETSTPFAILPNENGFYGWTGIMAWSYLFSASFTGLGAQVAAQDYWERALSGKTIKTIVWASFAAGIAYLILGIIPYILGIAAYQLNPHLTDVEIQSIGPWLLTNYFSPVVAVFIAVSMAAAVMSSADSGLLAAASIVGNNIYRIINPEATDKEILKWTKLSVTVGGVLSVILALTFQEIFRVHVFSDALLAIAAFPMITLGLFSNKTNNTGAIAGMYGGMGIWVFLSVLLAKINEASFWDTSEIALLPAVVCSFVIMWLVSKLTSKQDPPKPLLDYDGNELKKENAILSFRALFSKEEIE